MFSERILEADVEVWFVLKLIVLIEVLRISDDN